MKEFVRSEQRVSSCLYCEYASTSFTVRFMPLSKEKNKISHMFGAAIYTIMMKVLRCNKEKDALISIVVFIVQRRNGCF